MDFTISPRIEKVGIAVCYEEMVRSIVGPFRFNSAAPDDGNMMLLETAAEAMAQADIPKNPSLSGFYRYVRQARLVHGANEVHKMVLNYNLAAEDRRFW
jgi:hypothetical protein